VETVGNIDFVRDLPRLISRELVYSAFEHRSGGPKFGSLMMAAFNDSFYDIATPVQPAQTASRHFYSLALFRIKFVLVSHEVTVADQRGIISASQ
jgi:hypothetical protein